MPTYTVFRSIILRGFIIMKVSDRQLVNISRSAKSADTIKEKIFVKLKFAKHAPLLDSSIP